MARGKDLTAPRRYRSGTAAAVSIVLIGVALAAAWLLVAPAVLAPAEEALQGPLASAGVAPPAPAALVEGVKVSGSFQASQPRDPFRPLIEEGSPVPAPVEQGGGGENGESGDDGEDGDGSFAPSGTRVTLVEVREVGGVPRATVTVDGTSYEVGEGDTFAENFRVVSLEEDEGVFLFGDNAFELSVGQSILK
ncbi:MAG: hypothetical protein M3N51_00860 [Actinomycetota bacterium]|nr:hypothetical protein [Actinomycetota bacterium]